MENYALLLDTLKSHGPLQTIQFHDEAASVCKDKGGQLSRKYAQKVGKSLPDFTGMTKEFSETYWKGSMVAGEDLIAS